MTTDPVRFVLEMLFVLFPYVVFITVGFETAVIVGLALLKYYSSDTLSTETAGH